jgi:hypothetical protein
VQRTGIATVVALGLAGVSIALGMLYSASTDMARAELEARVAGYEMSEREAAPLLAAFDHPKRFLTALIAGTGGVACLGFGGVLGLFALFPARTPNRSDASPGDPSRPPDPRG